MWLRTHEGTNASEISLHECNQWHLPHRTSNSSNNIRIGLVARICRSQSSKDDQFRQGRGSIPRFGNFSFAGSTSFCWTLASASESNISQHCCFCQQVVETKSEAKKLMTGRQTASIAWMFRLNSLHICHPPYRGRTLNAKADFQAAYGYHRQSFTSPCPVLVIQPLGCLGIWCV